MIIRDLYRCPPEDLGRAIASSGPTLFHGGSIVSPSALEPRDIDYLVAHPDFDPSLSFVAYDGGDPVAYLVSRIEGAGEEAEAVWSLFGGLPEAEHGLEMVLDDAMDHWRQEGARRARKGRTGLLGTEPRLAEDAGLIEVLKGKDFEITGQSAEMVIELKKLSRREGAAEHEADLRRKGYIIRPAHPDEVAVVARQYHPRHTGWLSQEIWNLIARHLHPDALVVIEHRRQVIGYAAYLGWTLEGDCPELGPVFVDQVHRQAGLGSVVLRHALQVMKESGKPKVKVIAGPDRVAFYERAGFAVTTRFCRDAAADLESTAVF